MSCSRLLCLAVLMSCFLPLGLAAADEDPASDELERRFREHDRDGDGKLTSEELPYPRYFERLDADGDGFVTLDELRAAPRAGRGSARRTADGPPPPPMPELTRHLDIPYAVIEGVEPKLLSLDLYAPKTPGKHPVLVMIHGGGWRRGDKANEGMTKYKVPHFVSADFVYVSINYRLSTTSEIKHPVHIEDVATALAMIHDNVAKHGGDPDRIYVMGHSAGAHLAALIATDARRLKAVGKSLSMLKGAICLDSAAYDVPKVMTIPNARHAGRSLYESAFGSEPAGWRDASPLHHVAPRTGIPPMLFFHAGNRAPSKQSADEMVAALRKAGIPAQAVHAPDKDHAGINWCIGRQGDPYTKTLMAFLAAPLEAGKAAPVPAFDRLDKDGDGKLSRAEIGNDLVHEMLDRDGDGFVSRKEAGELP